MITKISTDINIEMMTEKKDLVVRLQITTDQDNMNKKYLDEDQVQVESQVRIHIIKEMCSKKI